MKLPAFTTVDAKVVPLDRSSVDTDAIIPKQFMKSIHRSGFGDFLFDEWRYLDQGELGQDCSNRPRNPDFPLNMDRYQGAKILLARDNFGCGSSREHAAWALRDYGIRVIIASGFADIFHDNCLKNGLLPITLAAQEIDHLFHEVNATPGYNIVVDLPGQNLLTAGGNVLPFSIHPDSKRRLQYGLDDIAITMDYADLIRNYELHRKSLEPWIFATAR